MNAHTIRKLAVWLLLILPMILLMIGGEMASAQTKSAAAPDDSPTRVGNQVISRGPPPPVPTPVADYPFAGDLSSQIAGAPVLTETGNGSGFSEENVDGVPLPVRTFDAGNGLRLDAADALVSDSVYTIQMAIRLSDLTGGGTNFVKLIDFGDLTNDFGLYATNNKGNSLITWFDGGQAFGVAGAVSADEWVQVVLTRDIDNNLTAYVDGIEQFTYVAATGETDVTGPLVFLDDDSATAGNEISAGAIACLSLYPTALDSATVATLDCEPVKRVGINGQACAFSSIGAAVSAAQSGDEILMEPGTYNERIGQVVDKDLALVVSSPESNCTQVAAPFGTRAVIDGTGVAALEGVGGIIQIENGAIRLDQVDLTNGAAGQGGLVFVKNGSFTTFSSSLSNGTVASDRVDPHISLDTNEPAGGCIYAENSTLRLVDTRFSHCRVVGPNAGQEPSDGDGGAIHARLGSVLEGGGVFLSVVFEDNSARNGGAVALIDSSAELVSPAFRNNTADLIGGGLFSQSGTVEFTELAAFENNAAGDVGGAIAVFDADLAIRSSINFPDATIPFNGNSAESAGAIFIQGASTGELDNPTLDGVVFDGNMANVFGGAVVLLVTDDIEIVDTIFRNNVASEGGAIYSQTSSSIIRSSAECYAYELTDPDRYCSEFRNNSAAAGAAIQYRIDNANNQILTTAFIGNDGPYAIELLQNGNEVSMESVWLFENTGGVIIADGDSQLQVAHGTFHNNVGSAYVGLEASSLSMFNSIAWGNGSGVSSLGTGEASFDCNFDQSGQAGEAIDPLLVTNADGQSHLSPASPAIDACSEVAQLPKDLDGRDRLVGPAADAGAFEFFDILFRNRFE